MGDLQLSITKLHVRWEVEWSMCVYLWNEWKIRRNSRCVFSVCCFILKILFSPCFWAVGTQRNCIPERNKQIGWLSHGPQAKPCAVAKLSAPFSRNMQVGEMLTAHFLQLGCLWLFHGHQSGSAEPVFGGFATLNAVQCKGRKLFSRESRAPGRGWKRRQGCYKGVGVLPVYSWLVVRPQIYF